MLCVLKKILSHVNPKKKTERLKGFKFRPFIDLFSDIVAVKWLIYYYDYSVALTGGIHNDLLVCLQRSGNCTLALKHS